MRYLNSLSRHTLHALAVIVMLGSTMCLTAYGRSYTSTNLPILETPNLLQTFCSRNLSKPGDARGPRADREQRSANQSDRFTSITGSEMSRFLATALRSGYGSAGQTRSRSNLSDGSTIFTFQSLPITLASQCDSSLSSNISRTEQRFSGVKQAKKWQLFERPLARSLKISLIAKRSPLYRPQFSEPATGPTSGRWLRHRSNWHGWLPRSTHEQHRYANFWTARSYASASLNRRSNGSISYLQRNLSRLSTKAS